MVIHFGLTLPALLLLNGNSATRDLMGEAI